jgi:hypothetical protein
MPTGVQAQTAVGNVTVNTGAGATAFPAGVSASGAVGNATAAGYANVLAQGLAAFSAIGPVGAAAGVPAIGFPQGVAAYCSTGIPIACNLVVNANQFSRDRKRVRLLIKGLNFSPKRAAETEIFAVDYAALLAPGETISSPVWSIAPAVGQDENAGSMLVGRAAFSGTIAAQIIRGGVPGVEYAPVCTVQTSFGQTLALPDVDEGHLYISL